MSVLTYLLGSTTFSSVLPCVNFMARVGTVSAYCNFSLLVLATF